MCFWFCFVLFFVLFFTDVEFVDLVNIAFKPQLFSYINLLQYSLSSIFKSCSNIFKYYSVMNDFSANPTQNVEKNFQLSRANRDLLQHTEYDVQVCLFRLVL